MRPVVIGGKGLVGSALVEALQKRNYDVFVPEHSEIDITSDDFVDKIAEYKPDAVFNTAVFQGMEPCENEPDVAFMVNVHATRKMAQYCGENGIKFVYISSEAVFDESPDFRLESDVPDPMNYYGLTKYNGEIMTRHLCENHYIFRLPVMFGTRQNKALNFLEKMYGLYSGGRKSIKVVDDIFSRPTYSSDAAEKIVSLTETNDAGIYHIVNTGEPVSSYDFVCEFFSRLGISDFEIGRAKAADFSVNEKGKKPLRTILGTSKCDEMRDWKEAMAEYTNKIKERGYV